VRRAALAALLLALAPGTARALEPVTVTAEGVTRITSETEAEARTLAFDAALLDAVFQVAGGMLPPGTLEVEEERVRGALAPAAAGAILTYRVLASGPRASLEEPGGREFRVELSATVDAAQVRGALRSGGLLAAEGDRPSVLVVAQALEEDPRLAGPLAGLEDYLKLQLAREGFVVVEPALHREGARAARSAIELARALGADVAVDAGARWRDRGAGERVVGGVMEVRLRATRAADGFQLATSRFDAPSYHSDPLEARARALDAMRDQVAQNLLLQLERNWQALASDRRRPVRLVLSSVSTLRQVDRVSEALRRRLGAQRVDLRRVSPRTAELEVHGRLSAGALQDRLTAMEFEGFRLEPVAVARERIELRVAGAAPSAAAAPGPASN
jgi:hypothetical protein